MLEARQLWLRRQGRALLQGVDFVLQPGRLTALLGPNGAGKSTLLRLLAGELQPDGGEVWMNDRPLTAWPLAAQAAQRAVLPQSSALGFDFTVREVAALGAPAALRAPQLDPLVRDALLAVGLADRAAQPYLTLSGGERQRVHLARVLVQLRGHRAQGPRYLLMDEPTASLDPGRALEVMALARALSREGFGVLVVMHDLNMASAWADHLCLMRAGQLVAAGPPADVIHADALHAAYGAALLIARHPHNRRPMALPPGPDDHEEDTP
jgi:iron complex transport system ATP-binding protein